MEQNIFRVKFCLKMQLDCCKTQFQLLNSPKFEIEFTFMNHWPPNWTKFWIYPFDAKNSAYTSDFNPKYWLINGIGEFKNEKIPLINQYFGSKFEEYFWGEHLEQVNIFNPFCSWNLFDPFHLETISSFNLKKLLRMMDMKNGIFRILVVCS